jgi:hypothetical protein
LRRKLIALNLLLAALVAAAGWQIRGKWAEARERERQILSVRVANPPLPPVPVVEPSAPVQAATYVEVAAKTLFSKDRNPTVVIEKPKEKDPPPFPAVHGVMDLGLGTTVFMTAGQGGQQKGYKEGDKIGDFKITKASRTDLEFEWEGKTFQKTVAELKPKPAPRAADAAAAPPPPAPRAQSLAGNVTSTEEVKKITDRMANGKAWIEVGGVNHACTPGDNAPAGAIRDGYRKVVRPSPFGQSCFWEPVR